MDEVCVCVCASESIPVPNCLRVCTCVCVGGHVFTGARLGLRLTLSASPSVELILSPLFEASVLLPAARSSEVPPHTHTHTPGPDSSSRSQPSVSGSVAVALG